MAFMSGATHVLQWPVQTVAKPQGGANRRKPVSVRIVRLQLAGVKLESLVIADQHAAVNTFPGLYTPPVTSRKPAVLEVAAPTRKGGRRLRYGR